MSKVLSIAGGVLALVFAAFAIMQVHATAVAGSAEAGATGLFFANSWIVFLLLTLGIVIILIVGAIMYAVTQK